MTAGLKALLTHRRAPIILAMLALLLTLPALGGGFVMDDHFHRNVLLRRGEWSAARPLWDLFAFVPADQGADGRPLEVAFRFERALPRSLRRSGDRLSSKLSRHLSTGMSRTRRVLRLPYESADQGAKRGG